MLSIPLYVFLFIYFLFLFFIALFFLVNVSHLFQTASLTFASFIVTLITIILFILVSYGTWYFLQGIDWKTPVILFDKSWLSGLIPTNQNILN